MAILRVGVKRIVDVVGSGLLLAAASPILVALAGLTRALEGSPVLFRQLRPGYLGRPFEIVKFRTMHDSPAEAGAPRNDDKRLTRFGQFIRRTSLDELPELWNVLRGDMSLVGPRPLLMEYLDRYTPEQARRHEVKPGITGLAQVSGRNALEWDDRLALDVWYVDNWSLMLDLRILARTVNLVVRREGVNAPGHATMPEFQGTRLEQP